MTNCSGHRLDPDHGPHNCAGCAAGLCDRCSDPPSFYQGDDDDAPDDCLNCGRCAACVERAKADCDGEE